MQITSANSSRVGPFLKWAGGKGQLLEQFGRFLPRSLAGRGYVEPFMGSGAVFFEVVQTRSPSRATLLDANPELVNLFVQVRDNVESLIPLLAEHRARHNEPGITDERRKTYYYGVRASRPDAGSLAAAARFLYLNKTCFNGLHRLNSRGEFNVPMGNYTAPTIFDPDHLRAASRLLEGVTLEVGEFRSLGKHVHEGDFVYADPPYEPLSQTSSFTAYAKDGFSRDDQAALAAMLSGLSDQCQWMASNSTATLIENLYDRPGMYKHYVMASRSINSVASGRGKIRELLVTNYEVGTPARAAPQQPLFPRTEDVAGHGAP
ncbi:MAG: Dam family site-specific DNA-(adenine-N6)-methyltransferase [Deltaproteobacteria bacterium]|nr:Dam family site-specific DNA-(adenine-N6)-methyltransferase [Deltaproteobacteria bacterium]